VDAGTRLAVAMTKPTLVTAGLMMPEGAPADAIVSVSVVTVMPVALPAVAAPITIPASVILKAVPAAIPATAVVMTMDVAVEAPNVAVIVETVVEPSAVMAVAVVPTAKKPEGKFKVIFPPVASALEVVKSRRTATAAFM